MKTAQQVAARPFDHDAPGLHFVSGFGLLCLGYARNLVLGVYTAESKKNRQFSHAWKIPLLGMQVFILYLSGFLAVLVGLGKIPPLHSLILLMFFFFIFLCYILWYLVEYFKNRWSSIASLRIAMMALVLAAVSYFSWTIVKAVLPSMMAALLSVIAVFFSLLLSETGSTLQRGNWLKTLCVLGAVILLGFVGYYALPFGKPRTSLVDLGLATKDLQGDIQGLTYSPDGTKIAFSQKTKDGWFLQVVNPENETHVVFKVPAGEGPFHPLFVDGGKSILLDAVQKDNRGLWKVNSTTGTVTVLRENSVEPIGDGTPWSISNGQFLFVTKTSSQYQLNSMLLLKGKSKVLFSSKDPILTPSWTATGREVVFADGIHGLPYVLDIKNKSPQLLLSEEERAEDNKILKGAPVDEILPAPDDFRYLYVSHKNGETTLSSVLKNGTKRVELYTSKNALSNISWLSDGQKVVFEQKGTWADFFKAGFLMEFKTIRILDANLLTVEDLIPQQISDHSPAGSPDGVKVAFVGGEGLWYPSTDSGIWVAVLR